MMDENRADFRLPSPFPHLLGIDVEDGEDI